MNKKILSASNLLKAISSLNLSSKLMNQTYLSQWDMYNTYVTSEKELHESYDTQFEKNLRAILFDLNDMINIYELGWSKSMLDPLLEEITSLNSLVGTLQEQVTKIPVLECSIENLAGRLAVEKYKCQELDKMQKRNQIIQDDLDKEIKVLKNTQQDKNIEKIEIKVKEQIFNEIRNTKMAINDESDDTDNELDLPEATLNIRNQWKAYGANSKTKHVGQLESRVFRAFAGDSESENHEAVLMIRTGTTPIKLGNAHKGTKFEYGENSIHKREFY